mgnify:CR=1 FL=1
MYEMLGQEQGIRNLVDRFYEVMDTAIEAKAIRAMHPNDLSSSKDKLVWFLSGRFGGPNIYIEKYGHPRLRMRHMPFAIDSDAAQAWMFCMRQALEEEVESLDLRRELMAFFEQVAHFMRNRRDS